MKCNVLPIKVVRKVQAETLTYDRALYVHVTDSVEVMGVKRVAGEQWLLTHDLCEAFLPPIGVVSKLLIHNISGVAVLQ